MHGTPCKARSHLLEWFLAKNLFEHRARLETEAEAPLATRMRPRSLDEFVGQHHLLAAGSALRASIEGDTVWSSLLWGPPGSGKTTLARLTSAVANRRFIQLSAVTSGVRDVRDAIAAARDERAYQQRRTLVFIDEIHRFNKAQQDALLPHVEDGTIVLWGATTENPYTSVTAPLLSRVRVLRLTALSRDDLQLIVRRAIDNTDRGLGKYGLTVTSEAIDAIVAGASGDARTSLNWIETAALDASEAGTGHVDIETVRRAVLERRVRYDRAGDDHYDTISAFIKSVRGSDPDAALLWLAKMLKAGEDPEFIARRLIILASEDIGNADPQGLSLAVAAAGGVERVGLPEGRFALAQATIYLSGAPKSNATGRALDAAEAAICEGVDLEVPQHLRTRPSRDPNDPGPEYVYPHDYPGNFVKQSYVSPTLAGTHFYDGRGSGQESTLWERLQHLRKSKDVVDNAAPPDRKSPS